MYGLRIGVLGRGVLHPLVPAGVDSAGGAGSRALESVEIGQRVNRCACRADGKHALHAVVCTIGTFGIYVDIVCGAGIERAERVGV